jgi:HemY protein
VCSNDKLWGKAEEYLKLAAKGRPSVAVHAALGELYEGLGRKDEAAEQFRAAARLAVGG